MNIQVNTDSIEVARLESLVSQIADELIALSDPNDTIIEMIGSSLHMTYTGRGFESIHLYLSNEFTLKSKIFYMTDVLNRLNKIKNYILECLA